MTNPGSPGPSSSHPPGINLVGWAVFVGPNWTLPLEVEVFLQVPYNIVLVPAVTYRTYHYFTVGVNIGIIM